MFILTSFTLQFILLKLSTESGNGALGTKWVVGSILRSPCLEFPGFIIDNHWSWSILATVSKQHVWYNFKLLASARGQKAKKCQNVSIFSNFRQIGPSFWQIWAWAIMDPDGYCEKSLGVLGWHINLTRHLPWQKTIVLDSDCNERSTMRWTVCISSKFIC